MSVDHPADQDAVRNDQATSARGPESTRTAPRRSGDATPAPADATEAWSDDADQPDDASPEVARALKVAADARARAARIRSQSFEVKPWTPRRSPEPAAAPPSPEAGRPEAPRPKPVARAEPTRPPVEPQDRVDETPPSSPSPAGRDGRPEPVQPEDLEPAVFDEPEPDELFEPGSIAELDETMADWIPASVPGSDPAAPAEIEDAATTPPETSAASRFRARSRSTREEETPGGASGPRFSRTLAAAGETRVAPDGDTAWSHVLKTDEAIGQSEGNWLTRLLRRLFRRPGPSAPPAGVRAKDRGGQGVVCAGGTRRPLGRRDDGPKSLFVAFCIAAVVTSVLFGGVLGLLSPGVFDRVRSWVDRLGADAMMARLFADQGPGDVVIRGLPGLAASGDVTAKISAKAGYGSVDRAVDEAPGTLQIRPAAYASDGYREALQVAADAAKSDPALAGLVARAEREPGQGDVLRGLGFELQLRGRFDAAVAMYRQAAQLEPDHVPTLYHWASALEAQGETDAAIAKYRAVLERDAAHPHAHHDLGALLAASGDIGGALEQYRRASAVDPDNPVIYYNWARLLENRGWLQAAVPLYEKASALAPDAEPGAAARRRLAELTAPSG